MGETGLTDHGNKGISPTVLWKIHNKSTFQICNLSLVQVIFFFKKRFLKSMIWKTFSFPYNRTFTILQFEKLLCKIMEKYKEAIIGFSWKAVLQAIYYKRDLSANWVLTGQFSFVSDGLILYVLVWCICSHPCTGLLCWWTCCSGISCRNHPVQH